MSNLFRKSSDRRRSQKGDAKLVRSFVFELSYSKLLIFFELEGLAEPAAEPNVLFVYFVRPKFGWSFPMNLALFLEVTNSRRRLLERSEGFFLKQAMSGEAVSDGGSSGQLGWPFLISRSAPCLRLRIVVPWEKSQTDVS